MYTNNLRFNYQQKRQNFGQSAIQLHQRPKASYNQQKDDPILPNDSEQQNLIAKKNVIAHEDPQKYSKIYSQIRINRQNKYSLYDQPLQHKKQTRQDSLKEAKNNPKDHIQPNKQYILPSSLPIIDRNIRGSNLIYSRGNSGEIKNMAKNEDFTHKNTGRRGLSISHYDIYTSSAKINHQSYQEVSVGKKQLPSKNSHKIERSNLRVQFYNEDESQLPEAREIFSENSASVLSKQRDKDNNLNIDQDNCQAITERLHEQKVQSKSQDKVINQQIQQSLKEQEKQEQKNNEQTPKFNIEDYCKVYDILKSIQTHLKSSILDPRSLIREIKHYLQIVASGNLDHLQVYDMPLNRLKIIKNALLFERIALIIISFAYSTNKIRQSQKYLINLISYTINNNLIIIKLLEQSSLDQKQIKNPVIAKSDRLITKKNHDSVRNNNDIILDSILKISKFQQAFSESFKEIIKNIGKNSLQQTFYNVLQYFSFFLCVSGLHNSIPFLAVAPNPYLKQTIDDKPTLVIDVVAVLCHGTKKSRMFMFRPYTDHFLAEMAQYYEIVSFSCGFPNQIDKVIDILDQHKYIKHRLYRHHAIMKNGVFYKDSQRIGRDLSKLIMIDSQLNYFQGKQHNNTITIPSWRGGKNDSALAELCPLLAAIALKRLDCRQATRRISEQHIKNWSEGIKYLNFGISLQ